MKKKIIIAVSAVIVILAVAVSAGGILSVYNNNKSKGLGSQLIKSTSAVDVANGQKLKIGTYNINFITSDEDIKSVAADISIYQLEVVCFQEVKYSKDDFTLEKLAKEAGFENYRFFYTNKNKDSSDGIGIISKYAFEDANSLKLTASTENKSSNILSYVKIRFNGIPLKIFTTQLTSESPTLRLAQFKDINKALSAETDNYVLTGDFSVTSFNEYSPLTDVELANREDQKFRTCYPENPDAFFCLDNIIIPTSLKFSGCERYNQTVSDHILFIGTVIVNEKKA